MTALLELSGLSKGFPIRRRGLWGVPKVLHAVDDISLSIAPGRSIGLVGESGCGKSTLARMAANLSEPSAGSVHVDGVPTSGNSEAARQARRKVQMIFQDPLSALDPRMHIGEQIDEVLTALGRRNGTVIQRRNNLLEQVGLSKRFAQRYPHQLSGGQRQRVVIARALAAEPELLICDEPLAALDVSVQAQIIGLFDMLARETGVSYLFITHQLQTVRHLCEEVVVMYAGRIVEQGATQEVFANPRHPYTRMLLSAVLDPRDQSDRDASKVVGEPPDPANLPSGCAFNPRCALRVDKCQLERPQLLPRDAGRQVACHLGD